MELARIHFNQGVRLGIDREFQSAVDEFNKAIELNPLYAEAFLYKGLAEIEMTNYQQAIRDFTVTIELDPAFSDQAHYFRGLARYHIDELEESIEDLTIAIRMNPDFVAFFQRGKANLKLREYHRSINDFEIALRLNPDFYEGYLFRGINLYFLKEYELAVQDLEIAKRHLPENPDAFYYSGLARTGIRNSYVAIEDLNRAIELDPDYAPAYEARATARQNTGDTGAANRDRALAQQQQSSVVQSTATPVAQSNPNVTEQSYHEETAPRTSTDINFSALFGSARTQQEDNQQDIRPEESNMPPATQPGAGHGTSSQAISHPVGPVNQQTIQQMTSGTYNSEMAPASPGGFGVQVASYTNTENLMSLADAYKAKYSKTVYVNVSNVNGRKLYKLIIGSFTTRPDAEQFRDELRKSDFPDSFLVVFGNL